MGSGPLLVRPRFGILGPLQVTDAAQRPIPLGGPRARALLAMLLLGANRPITSDRLVTTLWGEYASEGAATTLRTHVATVRRVLAAAGVEDALETRSGAYRLTVDPAELDAEVFEGLVHRAQEALGVGAPESAADLLQTALELWRGGVLADLGPPDFAEAAVARLAELRVVAEETAVAAALALGHHREMVPRLQGLVDAYPFHEQFTGQLMLALYRSGRQVDALTVYAETKQRLAGELGLDPGPDLQALEASVLRQDPTLLLAVGDRTPVPPARVPDHRPPPDAVFAALRRTPMVARDEALRRLADAWRETVEGGRSLVALSGAAGVGKSRLAAELAEIAASGGAAVLVGRCEPSLPYSSLGSALAGSPVAQQVAAGAPSGVRDGLRPLLHLDDPALPSAPGATEPAPQTVTRSVEWVLASLAADRPLLLVVEDAERLDDLEAEVLAALAVRLPERTLALLAFRDPPGTRHPPLAGLVGRRGVHELTRHVALEPLDRQGLRRLVVALYPEAEVTDGFVKALWGQTAGNPFFARELLRDIDPHELSLDRLGTGVPVGVRDVLRHRLGLLPPETREAVAAAAVLGRDVELTRLAGVLDRTAEQVVPALDQALAVGFLVESGQSWAAGYAFPHELMREAVYADIPLPRRRRLHYRALEATLADPHTADLDVIAAAGHAVEAGPAADPVEAAELVERAVRLAAGRYGYDVAIRLAEARLTLLARYASSSEQAHADVEVARLRLRAGYGYERAVELLERALSTYLTTGDLEAAGEVHSRLGGALVVPRPGMDVAMSLEHFAAAERLLPQASEMFSLHRGRLSAAMHALDTDSMAAAVDRCSTIADASDRPQLRVAADWGRGWLELDRGRPGAALASLERAWSTASDLGDPLLGWAPSNAGALICTVYLLDPTAGRSWCRRGLGQPRFDTLTHPNDALVDQLVLALATTGELDAARRAAGGLPEAAVGRRLVGFYLGEWEEAAHRWRAALAQDRAAGDRHDAVANARWLADALLALGDHAGAAEVLSEALEVAAAAPQVPSEVWLRARLATLPDTDLDRAAAHVTRCAEAMSGDEEWRGLAAEVALARSALATRHEDWPAAVGAARDAAAGFAAYRLPWRRVAALRAEAFALVGAGQPDEGRRRMADADAVLTTVGAPDRWRATTSTAPQRPVSTLEP